VLQCAPNRLGPKKTLNAKKFQKQHYGQLKNFVLRNPYKEIRMQLDRETENYYPNWTSFADKCLITGLKLLFATEVSMFFGLFQEEEN